MLVAAPPIAPCRPSPAVNDARASDRPRPIAQVMAELLTRHGLDNDLADVADQRRSA